MHWYGNRLRLVSYFNNERCSLQSCEKMIVFSILLETLERISNHGNRKDVNFSSYSLLDFSDLNILQDLFFSLNFQSKNVSISHDWRRNWESLCYVDLFFSKILPRPEDEECDDRFEVSCLNNDCMVPYLLPSLPQFISSLVISLCSSVCNVG